MRYSKYPSYRDSGVEWLGDVPSQWQVKQIKHIGQTTPGGTPSTTVEEYWNGDVPWLPSGTVQNCMVNYEDTPKFITNKGLYNSATKYLYKDTVMIALTGATCSNIGYLTFKATANQSVVGINTSNATSSKYLFYALLSQRSQILVQKTGGAQSGINDQNVRDLKITYPPLQEQQAIANYLDKVTAKIDTLTEKQTKLIELLKEKRQAVISTAVTRGLDSTAPMKDSEVEWLGGIPEHWVSTKVKNMLSTPITDGPHETPEFLDEGVPFVSAEAISKGYINFNKIRGHISIEANKKYSQKYSPMLHDVYMIKSGATTGITAMVEDRIDFNIWSPLAVFRTSTQLNPYYLLNYLRSSNFQKAVELYWTYGTQQNIGMNVLENLYITVPPIQEQNNIANYLDDKTTKIDNLITKASQAIALLKEKRTTLISAAVTGRIDVREAA